MKIQFAEPAEVELDEVFRYYERELPGMGFQFLDELTLAVNRIAEYPEAWQELDAGLRRCRLGRFPYGVIYAHRQDEVLVLAVAHLHRRPQHWLARLRSP